MSTSIETRSATAARAKHRAAAPSAEQLTAALNIYASLLAEGELTPGARAQVAETMRSAAHALLRGSADVDRLKEQSAELERTVATLSTKIDEPSSLQVLEYRWTSSHWWEMGRLRDALYQYLVQQHADGKVAQFTIAPASGYEGTWGFSLALSGPPDDVAKTCEHLALMYRAIT